MTWLGKPKPQSEAQLALERAQEASRRNSERWPEVVRVADTMRRLRVRNKFAEQFAMAMQSRRGQ